MNPRIIVDVVDGRVRVQIVDVTGYGVGMLLELDEAHAFAESLVAAATHVARAAAQKAGLPS